MSLNLQPDIEVCNEVWLVPVTSSQVLCVFRAKQRHTSVQSSSPFFALPPAHLQPDSSSNQARNLMFANTARGPCTSEEAK